MENIIFSYWDGIYTVKNMGNYGNYINSFKRRIFHPNKKS